MNKSMKMWALAGVVSSVFSSGVSAKTFTTSVASASVLGDSNLMVTLNAGQKNPADMSNAFSVRPNDFVVHSRVRGPATYALIGVGLLGLLLAHRRKYGENSASSQLSF